MCQTTKASANVCDAAFVKRFCYRQRLPPICTESGTEHRREVIKIHLNSDIHKESYKAARLASLSMSQKLQEVPLIKSINQMNTTLADKIGGLMYHVYNDAKNLTISAYSFPSHVVAAEMSKLFHINEPFTPFSSSNIDLQYISPLSQHEMMEAIVVADMPRFKREIETCLAASFRFDSSMDRTQKENQFELMKMINLNGHERLLFIGIGQVTESGATGHLKAIKEGSEETVGFDALFNIITHLSTDREPKNVGKHEGLWALLDRERKE
jgi:hypothetical protein